MTDYIKAFKKGLNAAENADRAKKEISKVLDDLDKQLMKETQNKISIIIKFYEHPRPFEESFILSSLLKPRKTYSSITAFNPSINDSPFMQLATWTMDSAGYPCKIVSEGISTTCEDKIGLENSLAELLQDALVGEKLYSLIHLEEDNIDD